MEKPKLKLKLNLNIKPSVVVNKRTTAIRVLKPKVDGQVLLSNGKFTVISEGTTYQITDDSYSCKGKKIIYAKRKDKNGNNIKIVRVKDSTTDMPSNFYIPFKDKVRVKGRIVLIDNIEMFHIIACYNPSCVTEIDDANMEVDLYVNK